MDNVNVDPKPAQQPLPVILGGSADGAGRAGELADGWIAGGAANPEAFAAA